MRVTVTREIDLSDLPDAPWRAALEDTAAAHDAVTQKKGSYAALLRAIKNIRALPGAELPPESQPHCSCRQQPATASNCR